MDGVLGVSGDSESLGEKAVGALSKECRLTFSRSCTSPIASKPVFSPLKSVEEGLLSYLEDVLR